jgi:asparagine synthase (glutamine-hydrolysing)
VCGICGVFSINGDEPVAEHILKRMTETLEHRGPDDLGHLLSDGVGLGFRRLSIIDLETGNQPLSNEDSSIYLICNGEIFNYRELREKLLAKGHHFRTRSDVEVLIHLYEEVGEDLLDHVNGQFAFVIFDKPRERLFIARDHFGVVPFFYTVAGQKFIFGSEIKAILAHPEVERRVDMTGLDQVLSLPGLVSPRTMFEGIESLPPGYCMTVDGRGVRTRCYWDMVFPAKDASVEARPDSFYREQLEHLLLESVRRRLQADVPVGAYLSGGLDSSLITSMMQANTSDCVRTFSITFGDQLINERDYQLMVAAQLDCRHHEIELDIEGIESRLHRVVQHTECPLKESYDTASLALSELARAEGVPVVLCGEGADELFAGYLGYRFDAFRQKSGAAQLGHREAELRRRVWGDENVFYEKILSEHEGIKRSLYSRAVNEQYDAFDFTRWPVVDTNRLKGIHPLHQRSYLDVKLRLGDHLLGDHGDRMLLANAVEGRFPFLDIEIAELVCRLPPDLKLRDYTEKFIIKEIAGSYVPQVIVEREKYGFNASGSPQLLRGGVEWIEDMLSTETIRRQGYFNPEEVDAIKRRYREPDFRLNLPYEDDFLFIVLTFGIFLEVFDMPSLG